VLIPWTAYLAFSLPSRQVSSHYNVAWVGFDVFLLVTLGATGFFALRRSRYLALTSASAATLLVVDAWFDVLTSPGRQVIGSIILAVVIELPLAGICAWLSYQTEHLAERRLSVPWRLNRSLHRRGRLGYATVTAGTPGKKSLITVASASLAVSGARPQASSIVRRSE
jgi:hypothetical protein